MVERWTAVTWTPAAPADYDRLRGMDLYSADGERLGTVGAVCHPAVAAPEAPAGPCLVVRPGGRANWFGGAAEAYVPASAVALVTEEGVWLAYPKHALVALGWTEPPVGVDRCA